MLSFSEDFTWGQYGLFSLIALPLTGLTAICMIPLKNLFVDGHAQKLLSTFGFEVHPIVNQISAEPLLPIIMTLLIIWAIWLCIIRSFVIKLAQDWENHSFQSYR